MSWVTSNIYQVNRPINVSLKPIYDRITYDVRFNNPWVGKSLNLKDSAYQELRAILTKIFHDEVNSLFGELKFSPDSSNDCWAYVSNKKFYIPGVHNHLRTSTINGVYYLNIPSSTSGGISFYDGSYKRYLTLQPRQFDLVIFPNYLLHEPRFIDTEEYRIAINMEIKCSESVWEQINEYNN